MTINKMSRCFMNGKVCIYEREIDNLYNNKKKSDVEKKAFVIMPFEDQLNLLYQLEIAPFFRRGGGDPEDETNQGDPEYKCIPERADDIRQMGFIICEKICKKIQEASYIVADLSLDNPNVFYELGLAAALRKEIIPICIEDVKTNKDREDKDRGVYLSSKLGIDNLLRYPRFGTIKSKIRGCSWQTEKCFHNFVHTSGYSIAIIEASGHKIRGSTECDEGYEFGKICQTAVGTAISQIFSTENMKQEQKSELSNLYNMHKTELFATKLLNSQSSLNDVIEACKKAACILVDISDHKEVLNFFWLGYIHGIGGNAIPIASYGGPNSSKENISPFDIRALWQISFKEDHPIDLLNPLKNILEHIYLREAKNLNRESFWKDILKDNQVSVFLGSLYLGHLRRNTIGDWDYRAAAEITSYLSASKETMKITLESPIPKLVSQTEDKSIDTYIDSLKKQLKENNSIIIGSADVNDLTEIALCEILKQKSFTQIPNNKDMKFKGYIAYKQYSKHDLDTRDSNVPSVSSRSSEVTLDNAFYIREEGDSDIRGFLIRESGRPDELMKADHCNPGDIKTGCVNELYGQLVVAKDPDTEKWIVIISGISGPATLGIAQMLTGCMYEEFTVNKIKVADSKEEQEKYTKDLIEIKKCVKTVADKNKTFTDKVIIPSLEADDFRVPYDNLSESMLSSLFKIIKDETRKIGNSFKGVNALITVHVYYPSIKEGYSNDERKVIIWEFSNISPYVGQQWFNPNNLRCTYTD